MIQLYRCVICVICQIRAFFTLVFFSSLNLEKYFVKISLIVVLFLVSSHAFPAVTFKVTWLVGTLLSLASSMMGAGSRDCLSTLPPYKVAGVGGANSSTNIDGRANCVDWLLISFPVFVFHVLWQERLSKQLLLPPLKLTSLLSIFFPWLACHRSFPSREYIRVSLFFNEVITSFFQFLTKNWSLFPTSLNMHSSNFIKVIFVNSFTFLHFSRLRSKPPFKRNSGQSFKTPTHFNDTTMDKNKKCGVGLLGFVALDSVK